MSFVIMVMGAAPLVAPFIGGLIMANLLDRYPHNAGAASALFGVFQFSFGAGTSGLVGTLSRDPILGTALVMAAMGLVALAAHRIGITLRGTSAPAIPRQPSAPPTAFRPSHAAYPYSKLLLALVVFIALGFVPLKEGRYCILDTPPRDPDRCPCSQAGGGLLVSASYANLRLAE